MTRDVGSISPAQDQFIGVMMVVLTLVGWTSIPLFLRHFASQIDPWTSNGWRYGFAALIWCPVLILGAARKRLPEGLWRKAAWPAVVNSIGQVFFTSAFYHVDSTMAAFGLRSNIICAAIGAAIFFAAERRILASPPFLIGMVMVLAGTGGTLVLDDGFAQGSSPLGILFAVLAGAFYAAYALAVRMCMKGIPTLVSFAAISLYTAGVMIVLMLALGERMGATAIDLAPTQFVLLLVSSFVGIAMGHVTYYMSIARLGVTVSSGVIQLQPFTVAVASIPIEGKFLSGPQWALGTVAVAGTLVMLVVQNRMSRRLRAEMAASGAPTPAHEAELGVEPGGAVADDAVAAASEAERDAGQPDSPAPAPSR
ncbi:MAG: DMT family transporter [Phycisphaerales bacterium]|nr:DMT family transporter [Phycisphaerales bacterium]